MKNKFDKGFSIIEVIICLTVISVILSLCTIASYRSIYSYNEDRINYSGMQLKYNLLQIIKSDSYFYQHPDLYYDNSNNSIKVQVVDSTTTIYIYFDDYNEETEIGFYRIYAQISCTVSKIGNCNRFYYSIQVFVNLIGVSKTQIGGINHFYKMEKA